MNKKESVIVIISVLISLLFIGYMYKLNNVQIKKETIVLDTIYQPIKKDSVKHTEKPKKIKKKPCKQVIVFDTTNKKI
jgi:hypothetical protein